MLVTEVEIHLFIKRMCLGCWGHSEQRKIFAITKLMFQWESGRRCVITNEHQGWSCWSLRPTCVNARTRTHAHVRPSRVRDRPMVTPASDGGVTTGEKTHPKPAGRCPAHTGHCRVGHGWYYISSLLPKHRIKVKRTEYSIASGKCAIQTFGVTKSILRLRKLSKKITLHLRHHSLDYSNSS